MVFPLCRFGVMWAWEGLSRNNRLIERVIYSEGGHGDVMTNKGYHRVPGEKV